jgi:hypothetical protein
MATYTPKQMYVGQPGTSDTLLYTAPAGGAIVKEIAVTNTTGSAATITLGLKSGGTLAAANHLLTAVSIPANTEVTYPLSQVLGNAETIRALQGTSTALTIHASGIEIS